MPADKVDPKALKPKDVVSQDRNWVLRINSQLTSEQKWDTQWGYMKAQTPTTSINDKIEALEEEVKRLDGSVYTRTSDQYGHGEKVELFSDGKYNITKNNDLRALERRLPKGWKKEKWTAPADPFDPLSKGKKK